MHELECAIHTFAHAYGVSKVRVGLLMRRVIHTMHAHMLVVTDNNMICEPG